MVSTPKIDTLFLVIVVVIVILNFYKMWILTDTLLTNSSLKSTYISLFEMLPTNNLTLRPTPPPSEPPTMPPTQFPSFRPTSRPTHKPSPMPTNVPTHQPTNRPSTRPSAMPSSRPTPLPTQRSTLPPPQNPTVQPSLRPTPSHNCNPKLGGALGAMPRSQLLDPRGGGGQTMLCSSTRTALNYFLPVVAA